MKSFSVYFLFLNLFLGEERPLDKIIAKDLSIFSKLHIKTRSDLLKSRQAPELFADPSEKGYSAYFNRNYISPKFGLSEGVFNMFMEPKATSDKNRAKYNAPDSIFFLDSVRRISAIIHEVAHYLEDTAKYNTAIYNEIIFVNPGIYFVCAPYPQSSTLMRLTLILF